MSPVMSYFGNSFSSANTQDSKINMLYNMSPSTHILQFLLSKYKNTEASASGSPAGRQSVRAAKVSHIHAAPHIHPA